ncbi:hypothetical protein M514_13751 [Trichuris suis]|uniref:Uncharacterized protein n=1 Tax=Trichuris suis TaxID=68888 RepID=A0A085LK77_9BILA|nr:hypothetical protein M513_13751 [Trichuris suis]KFD59931.1 hypothetical protein M514_13751 [Trichuris suis]
MVESALLGDMGKGFSGSAHTAASPAEDPPVVRISSTPKGLHTRGDERSPCVYCCDETMPGHALSDKPPIGALLVKLAESSALVSAKDLVAMQPRRPFLGRMQASCVECWYIPSAQ